MASRPPSPHLPPTFRRSRTGVRRTFSAPDQCTSRTPTTNTSALRNSSAPSMRTSNLPRQRSLLADSLSKHQKVPTRFSHADFASSVKRFPSRHLDRIAIERFLDRFNISDLDEQRGRASVHFSRVGAKVTEDTRDTLQHDFGSILHQDRNCLLYTSPSP